MTDSKQSLLRKRRADFRDEDETDSDEVKRLTPATVAGGSAATATDGPVSAAAKRRAASEGKAYKKMTPGEQKSYLFTEVSAALRDPKHYLRKDAEDDMAAQRAIVKEGNAVSVKKLVEAERKNDSAAMKKIKEQVSRRNAAFRDLERRYQSRINRKYLEDMLHKMLMQDERNTKRMKTTAEETVTDDDSDTDTDDEDEDDKSDPERTDTESDPDGEPDSGDDDEKADADGDIDMKTDRKPVSKGVQLKLSDHEQIDVLAYCEDGLDVAAKAVRAGMQTVVEAAREIWALPELGKSPIIDVEIPASVSAPVRIRTAKGAFGPAVTATEFKLARKAQNIIINTMSSLNELETPSLEGRIAFDDIQMPLLAARAMLILMGNAEDRIKLAEDSDQFGRIESLLFSVRLSELRIGFAMYAPSLVGNLDCSLVIGNIVQFHDLILSYLLPQFHDFYAVPRHTTADSLIISEQMELFKHKEDIVAECKTRSRDKPRLRDDPVVWREAILPARLDQEFNEYRRELGAILKLPVERITKQFLNERHNSVLSALKDVQFRRKHLSDMVQRMIEMKSEMMNRKGLCPVDRDEDVENVDMKDASSDAGHDSLVACSVIIESLDKLLTDVMTNPKKPFEGFSNSDVKLLETAIPARFVAAIARLLKVPDIASLPPTGSLDGTGYVTSTAVEFYNPAVLYEAEAKRHDEVLKREDAEESATYKRERALRTAAPKTLTDKERNARMKEALEARAKRRAEPSGVRAMIVDDEE